MARPKVTDSVVVRIHPECYKAVEKIRKAMSPNYEKKWGRKLTFMQASKVLGFRYNNPMLFEEFFGKIPIEDAIKIVESER